MTPEQIKILTDDAHNLIQSLIALVFVIMIVHGAKFFYGEKS